MKMTSKCIQSAVNYIVSKKGDKTILILLQKRCCHYMHDMTSFGSRLTVMHGFLLLLLLLHGP